MSDYLTKDSFERLYVDYYPMLCMIAYEYTRSRVLAEEMVGETFLNLWERRRSINITTSEKHYLIRCTQNTCLQYIRKRRLQAGSLDDGFFMKHIPWSDDYPLGNLLGKELARRIEQTVFDLPPQCRKIFLLSRDEQMSYRQISETLQISENTVKSQIKTALSRMRSALSDYLVIIIPAILIFSIFF